jgi:hypothetical protein
MEQTTENAALSALPQEFVARIHDLSETATVCIGKQFRIPEGWVIIGETVLYELPGTWPNGWIIKRPAETELVCGVSPIPENYVKIEHVGCDACPGVWPNAWKIERLVSPMDE